MLSISSKLADVQWGDTNLAVVDWSQIIILGDEHEAVLKIDRDNGEKKGCHTESCVTRISPKGSREQIIQA